MTGNIGDRELTWYLQEIWMHCTGARLEYRGFLDKVNDDQFRQTRFVWYQLWSFLSHAATLSKYVEQNSNSQVASSRKAALRSKLGISAKSPILNRSARDNTEHFDERIDNWVRDGNSAILEIVVPDRSACDYLGLTPNRIRRCIILSELVFASEYRNGIRLGLELEPLNQEIARIDDEYARWMKQESPYHFLFP